MLVGNGALEWVLLVFVAGEEVVVMVDEIMGEVFSVWMMGSVLMFWAMLSVSSTVVGVCALGGDGVAGRTVVVGWLIDSSRAACNASAGDWL